MAPKKQLKLEEVLARSSKNNVRPAKSRDDEDDDLQTAIEMSRKEMERENARRSREVDEFLSKLPFLSERRGTPNDDFDDDLDDFDLTKAVLPRKSSTTSYGSAKKPPKPRVENKRRIVCDEEPLRPVTSMSMDNGREAAERTRGQKAPTKRKSEYTVVLTSSDDEVQVFKKAPRTPGLSYARSTKSRPAPGSPADSTSLPLQSSSESKGPILVVLDTQIVPNYRTTPAVSRSSFAKARPSHYVLPPSNDFPTAIKSTFTPDTQRQSAPISISIISSSPPTIHLSQDEPHDPNNDSRILVQETQVELSHFQTRRSPTSRPKIQNSALFFDEDDEVVCETQSILFSPCKDDSKTISNQPKFSKSARRTKLEELFKTDEDTIPLKKKARDLPLFTSAKRASRSRELKRESQAFKSDVYEPNSTNQLRVSRALNEDTDPPFEDHFDIGEFTARSVPSQRIRTQPDEILDEVEEWVEYGKTGLDRFNDDYEGDEDEEGDEDDEDDEEGDEGKDSTPQIAFPGIPDNGEDLSDGELSPLEGFVPLNQNASQHTKFFQQFQPNQKRASRTGAASQRKGKDTQAQPIAASSQRSAGGGFRGRRGGGGKWKRGGRGGRKKVGRVAKMDPKNLGAATAASTGNARTASSHNYYKSVPDFEGAGIKTLKYESRGGRSTHISID